MRKQYKEGQKEGIKQTYDFKGVLYYEGKGRFEARSAVEWFGDDQVIKEYAHLMNLEFNKWYKVRNREGLKSSSTFLKEIEAIFKRYYARNPTSSIVANMQDAIQSLIITYLMFTHYRLETFRAVRYCIRNLKQSFSEVDKQVLFLEQSKNCGWKDIKSC